MPDAFVRSRPGALHAMEALEDAWQLPSGMPTPVSRTVSSTRPIALTRARPQPIPSKRELQGVGEKVQDDLLPHVPIDEDRCVDAARIRPRIAGRLARSPIERRRRARGSARRCRSACTTPAPAGFDARKVEQRVHQLRAAVPHCDAGSQSARVVAAISGPCDLREQVFRRAQHQRKRRSELVTDVAEEAVFARSISVSASARRRASSSATALLMAVAIWSAASSKKSR